MKNLKSKKKDNGETYLFKASIAKLSPIAVKSVARIASSSEELFLLIETAIKLAKVTNSQHERLEKLDIKNPPIYKYE